MSTLYKSVVHRLYKDTGKLTITGTDDKDDELSLKFNVKDNNFNAFTNLLPLLDANDNLQFDNVVTYATIPTKLFTWPEGHYVDDVEHDSCIDIKSHELKIFIRDKQVKLYINGVSHQIVMSVDEFRKLILSVHKELYGDVFNATYLPYSYGSYVYLRTTDKKAPGMCYNDAAAVINGVGRWQHYYKNERDVWVRERPGHENDDIYNAEERLEILSGEQSV